jgi:hypothetical protein
MKIKETEEYAKDLLVQYEDLTKTLEERETALIKFISKKPKLTTKQRNEISLEYDRLSKMHNEIGLLEFILFK